MQPSIRLVIVDDHQIVLDSLKMLFGTIENITVAVTFTDSRNVMSFLEEHEVDIVVSDLHMPHLSGIDLTLVLRERFPTVKVLLLTMAEDATHIREAIKAGVNGYILKKSGREELEKAIYTLMSGRKYYSEAVIEELSSSAPEDLNDARPDTILHLTSREIEIIKLIANEFSTNEISDILCISVPTVETHRRNLMQKLSVKSVAGVVKYAMRHGLVK
ncbi:response regulator [Runella limosa]|uniref:response regulator n=1 Tax=Runella limosa TaxID=370978 RepID=UPI00041A86F9|nr:response regulator transcription factor [Runella limosa]MCA0233072.1 response regulator transcription factor [Bacteroidota bacterium]